MRIVRKILVTVLVLALSFGLASPALAQNPPFHDVSSDAWYADAVQFVYEEGIMGGVGGNQFNPQGKVSRAEVTALLFRTYHGRSANASDAQDNPFADVGDNWYAPYVTWAHANGIVNGTSAETFHPHGNVTRQEFAVMVYRYAMEMTVMGNVMASRQWSQFTDHGQIAPWAHVALHWVNGREIMTGSTATTINPTGTATRAEAATMMMRLVEHPIMTLCPDVIARILAGIADFSPVDFQIDHYFGTYNDSLALMVRRRDSSFPDVVWEEEVAGVIFHYNSGQSILVWHDGAFYSLPNAYEQGLLTAENIRAIHIQHQRAFFIMYEANG